MLSNTLRIKIRYLKLIHFLHPRYHPKIIGDILKNVKKKTTKKQVRLLHTVPLTVGDHQFQFLTD